MQRSWVGHIIDKVEVKSAFHGHLAELVNIKFIMPSIPNFGVLGALLGFEKFMLIFVPVTHEIEIERLVRRRWTIFVVLHNVVSCKIVNEVLEWDTRKIAFKKLEIVILRVPHILQSSLHSLGNYLLVLQVILYFLRYVASLHEASVLSR